MAVSEPAVRLIRHATLRVRLAGVDLLVDPMLSPAGTMPPIPNSPNDRRNPLVELPEVDLSSIDAVVVTHTHRDHFDDRAGEELPADRPIFCQPEDEDAIADAGFADVRPVHETATWRGIEFARTGGRHGTGDLRERMGPVSGFVLGTDGTTLYLAGDTLPCPEVEAALDTHRPGWIVLNAGGARFVEGDPITMTGEDVSEVCLAAPDAGVIAVHMDAINHCLVTREDLRASLDQEGLLERVRIPDDGEWVQIQ